MTTNVKKVLHAGISVYNMEESLAWYKKNLGFEVVKNDGYVPPLKAKIVFIEKDGFQIELFEYDEPKKIPEDRLTPNTDLQTVGTKHIAFATDDMDALKAWIPSLFNIALIVSDTSIVIVPTSTGCPFACAAFTSSTTA